MVAVAVAVAVALSSQLLVPKVHLEVPHLPDRRSDKHDNLHDTPPNGTRVGHLRGVSEGSLDFAHVPLLALDVGDFGVELAEFRGEGGYVVEVGSGELAGGPGRGACRESGK
jgi:hypothetical protein